MYREVHTGVIHNNSSLAFIDR